MARLTSLSREGLIRRHLDESHPRIVLAAEAGISLRTANKWLARYRSGDHTSLADRRNVRSCMQRTLRRSAATAASGESPPPVLHPQEHLQGCGHSHHHSGSIVEGTGLSRLHDLEPKPPVEQYQ